MRSSVRPAGARSVLAPAAVDDELLRRCGDCRSEQLFERLPCPDGHGDDCPDLVCTGCGGVVVLSALVPVAAPAAPAPLAVSAA